MRLWFAAGSDVPLYQQLVTQVILAILAEDLRPGDRLPSTRELARRFHLHPNTVSAGYRQLEREGWVQSRRGSGVYVRPLSAPVATPEQRLDHHIAGFFRAVRELQLPAEVVRARVTAWLAAPPPDHLLVIDPDDEARRILVAELAPISRLPVRGLALRDIGEGASLAGAVPLCRPSQQDAVRQQLPAGVELLPLPITSATSWLAPLLAHAQGQLIAVVSHWPEFLTIARTMFSAAGVPAEALLVRQAGTPRWARGLAQAAGILCDAHTASSVTLPQGPRVIVFPLIAPSVRALLRPYLHPPAL